MTSEDLGVPVAGVLERFGLSGLTEMDPVVVAVEAAVAAIGEGLLGPMTIAQRALQLLPPRATGIERGLAIGIALCLSSETSLGQAFLSETKPKPDLWVV